MDCSVLKRDSLSQVFRFSAKGWGGLSDEFGACVVECEKAVSKVSVVAIAVGTA